MVIKVFIISIFFIFPKMVLYFQARAVVKFNLVKIQQKDVENVKIFCHKINWTIFRKC